MADNPADFFNTLTGPEPQANPERRVYVNEPEPQGKDNPANFFKEIAEPAPPAGAQYGSLETAGRHAIHGLTSGFSDELAGARAASPLNKIWSSAVPGGEIARVMSGLARVGYENIAPHLGYDAGTHGTEDYKKARDEERKALEESHTQHPFIATGADIAGSMAIPGGAALKAPTMAARALRGALVSGAQGAVRGAGEAPEIENVPESSAKGAAIAATIGAPVNALLGPRGVSAAKQAIINTADKYGVQLPYYMISDSPIVQFYGKGMDQLPFVGGAVSKASERAKAGVQGIRDELVDTGSGIANATPTEARTVASKAAEAARDAFVADAKKVSEQNYSAVISAMTNPSFRTPPMNMFQEIANQAAKLQGYGGSPGPVLQTAVEAAQVRGGLTYEALKNLRTDLYRRYRTMEGRGGTDYADYVGIIGSITKDMENVVHQAGGQKAVNLWNKANAQHGIGKDIGAELNAAVGKGTGDTSAADTIWRNLGSVRPNIGEVNTLKHTMKPQEWEKVQAGTVARMGADDAGNFSIQKFISANNKMADAGRDALFGKTGTPQRDAYDAVLKLGASVQNVERFANVSKTAPMMLGAGAALQLYNDYKEGNYLNTPIGLAGGATLAAILARPATARSASAFSKAMDKYINTPTMWAAGKVPRAVETAARNFAISIANTTGADKNSLIGAFTAPTPLWNQ